MASDDTIDVTPEIEALLLQAVAVVLPEPAGWDERRDVELAYYDPDTDAQFTVRLHVVKIGVKPWRHHMYGCPKVCQYHPDGIE